MQIGFLICIPSPYDIQNGFIEALFQNNVFAPANISIVHNVFILDFLFWFEPHRWPPENLEYLSSNMPPLRLPEPDMAAETTTLLLPLKLKHSYAIPPSPALFINILNIVINL